MSTKAYITAHIDKDKHLSFMHLGPTYMSLDHTLLEPEPGSARSPLETFHRCCELYYNVVQSLIFPIVLAVSGL
jgi:hypothetical protein